MREKEKAIEVVYRYYLFHPFQKLSKQFALTNGDEIIRVNELMAESDEFDKLPFLKEVKEEINKI